MGHHPLTQNGDVDYPAVSHGKRAREGKLDVYEKPSKKNETQR